MQKHMLYLLRTHTLSTHAKNGLKIKATVTAVRTKWKWNECLWMNRKKKEKKYIPGKCYCSHKQKGKKNVTQTHVLSLILTKEFCCKTDTQNPIVNMNRIERRWKNASKIDPVREMLIQTNPNYTHTHTHLRTGSVHIELRLLCIVSSNHLGTWICSSHHKPFKLCVESTFLKIRHVGIFCSSLRVFFFAIGAKHQFESRRFTAFSIFIFWFVCYFLSSFTFFRT